MQPAHPTTASTAGETPGGTNPSPREFAQGHSPSEPEAGLGPGPWASGSSHPQLVSETPRLLIHPHSHEPFKGDARPRQVLHSAEPFVRVAGAKCRYGAPLMLCVPLDIFRFGQKVR